MAAWIVQIGVLSVLCMISFVFLGCPGNDKHIVAPGIGADANLNCSSNCNCDYVPYSPVCGDDGITTYITACHAGCQNQNTINDKTIYTDCLCINNASQVDEPNFGYASSSSCAIDCTYQFYIFLGIVCLLNFSGGTGRASTFLITIRCVKEKDKSISMGFGLMAMSLFSFIPAPIFFGYLLDQTCLVWGKTCEGNGNCWIYDLEALRYLINLIAAGFISLGTLCDFGVFCTVKSIKIYDDQNDDRQKVVDDTEIRLSKIEDNVSDTDTEVK
uniref:Putative organic anion transporter n=1 Tax=Xenopsylla cheopis TaxID=163159 RepID=A0A6M2E1I6_XENCH